MPIYIIYDVAVVYFDEQDRRLSSLGGSIPSYDIYDEKQLGYGSWNGHTRLKTTMTNKRIWAVRICRSPFDSIKVLMGNKD